MTLFSDLVQVYEDYTRPTDTEQHGLAGSALQVHNRVVRLLPIDAAFQQAHIQVTIDEDGDFVFAEVVPKSDATTMIPVNIESANRTNQIAPHPLHDKLEYVAGDYIKYGGQAKKADRYTKYMAELAAWCTSQYSNELVKIVYQYLRKGTLIDDLVTNGILFAGSNGQLLSQPTAELDQKDEFNIFKVVTGKDQLASFVRFNIDGEEDDLWDDQSVFDDYLNYYLSTFDHNDPNQYGLDYVTGTVGGIAQKSPRFLRNPGDGAKLISANDTSGFTFRGRFDTSMQAAQIGYLTTQKAHNALTWLIALRSAQIDGRVYLTWLENPTKVIPVKEKLFDITASSLDFVNGTPKNEQIKQEDLEGLRDNQSDFSNQLSLAIHGYQASLQANPQSNQAHLLQLDAAVPGRLAVLDYRTMSANEFFDRLTDWYRATSWLLTGFDEKTKKPYSYYGAPSLSRIAHVALGAKAKDTLVKNMVTSLVACEIDRRPIPLSVLQALNNKVNQPASFDSLGGWRAALQVACAVNRNYYAKEGYTMALSEENVDRNYLFGRLLAVANQIEVQSQNMKAARTGKSGTSVMTNALRYKQTFVNHPRTVWLTLSNAIIPYLDGLGVGSAKYYQELISRITDKFTSANFNDQSLNGICNLGYESQMMVFRNKKEQKAEETKND